MIDGISGISVGNGGYTYPATHVGTLNSTANALLLDSTTFSNVQIADGITQLGNGDGATTPADHRAAHVPGWTTQQEASPKQGRSRRQDQLRRAPRRQQLRQTNHQSPYVTFG